MARVTNINISRLIKARRSIPNLLASGSKTRLEIADQQIHNAIGLMLSDASIDKTTKITELRKTVRLYKRLTSEITHCR
jgi:hypothetical protein